MNTLKYLVERKFDVSNLLETSRGPNEKVIARATFCEVAREFFKVVDIVNYLGIPHSNYYRYLKYFNTNSHSAYLSEIKNELIEEFKFSQLDHDSLMDLISDEWEFVGFSENNETMIKLKNEDKFFNYLENLRENLHEIDLDDIINNQNLEDVIELNGLKFGGVRFDLTRLSVGEGFDIYEPTERVYVETDDSLCEKLGEFARDFTYDFVQFLINENII